MQSLFARRALTNEGWKSNVRIDIDQGRIVTVAPSAIGAGAYDLLLPGMPNVHSHAFQRAMAGLTEHASGAGNDNFWSWREVMYRFLERLTPEHVEAIARYFYIELLKHGYTAVGEFHYVHHDASGKPYENPAEMSERIVAAADVGIGLTLLPVLYQSSNFGGKPAVEGQRRFLHSTEDFLRLVESLKQYKEVTLGVAPHSLRAVTTEALSDILAAFPQGPVHIHAAEQVKEVEDSLAFSGKRPVEWLLDTQPVNERWCLIHSTHLNDEEVSALAASRAVAGLCPTTEGNLGDGIFPAERYLRASGRFGIGSDSHVGINPFEELRLLEYGQRLLYRRRTVLCDEAIPSVGRNLYQRAVAGGRQALGIGERADFIAIDCSSPMLEEKQGDDLLDALIFGTPQPKVTDVFVGGRHVIKDGRHPDEVMAQEAMRQTMREILA